MTLEGRKGRRWSKRRYGGMKNFWPPCALGVTALISTALDSRVSY